MRKNKILVFVLICLMCFVCSCDFNDNEDNNPKKVYDFGEMTYGIAMPKNPAQAYDDRMLINNEINPFDENYIYSDKVQRQAYIKSIESKYNIKIDFTVDVSSENCYAVAWNTYPLINRSYPHDFVRTYAYPLYNSVNKEGILKDSKYINNDLKMEMGTLNDELFVYYPGNIYSYNFLYYNSSKDFGEYDPYALYQSGNWTIDNYKYVLQNYCDNTTELWNNQLSLFDSEEYYTEVQNYNTLSAILPSELAKGLAAANGMNILNSDGYNGQDEKLTEIFENSLDLFYNYYGYTNNDVLNFYKPRTSIYNSSYTLSSFLCDNTIVAGNLYDLYLKELGVISNSNTDVKWQIVPYPSNDYTSYTSVIDELNQVGFTIVGDYYYSDEEVNSFNETFTRDIAFTILYDLYDGYYEAYPTVQEANIKEFLSKHLNNESIDLFFELNKNLSHESINVLAEVAYKTVVSNTALSYGQELETLPLDSFLLMDEWVVENYLKDSTIKFNNKFDYEILNLLSQTNEVKSIHKIYEDWYQALIK